MSILSYVRFVPLLLVLVIGMGLVGTAEAETKVGGTLQGETAWTKDASPYIVTGDIVIPAGSRLHIGPGVTVRFKPDIRTDEGHNAFDLEILVEGVLVLEGAAGDTVVLTSDASRRAYTDWQGIVVRGPEARAELNAAVVEYANEGINCYQGEVVVKNSTVRRCSEYGIVLYEGKGSFENVVVTGIGNRGGTAMGISVDRGSEVTIRDSYLIGIQNGLSFARSSTGRIENTMISLCAKRAALIRNSDPTFHGCTITSNELGFSISANAAPVINGSNIFENATYDVVVASDFKGDPVKLDMTGNWWGETSLGLIEERIVDGLDDETIKAYVEIDPVLTEAVVLEATSEP
jgi:hypothetical protein